MELFPFRSNHRSVFSIFFIFALSSLLTLYPIKKSDGGEAMDQQHAIVLTKQDNGKEIRVKYGEVIQIELKIMGAAGYDWFVDNLDGKYLELIIKETKRMLPQGVVGTPFLGVWAFKTIKRGHREIKMAQYRPWEGVGKGTEIFSIKLDIE